MLTREAKGDTILEPKSTLIDMERYGRARQFAYFNQFEVPFTSLTCKVDIGDFYERGRIKGYKFFAALCMVITKSANEVPEFRHRIVGDDLIEFDRVYPAVTVLDQSHDLMFAKGVYSGQFEPDYDVLVNSIERAKAGLDQEDVDEKPYQIFVSNFPWVSFTSVTHPYFSKNKSIPIFTTGKIIEEAHIRLVPVAVQSNHALIDGFHISKFYERLAENLKNFAP